MQKNYLNNNKKVFSPQTLIVKLFINTERHGHMSTDKIYLDNHKHTHTPKLIKNNITIPLRVIIHKIKLKRNPKRDLKIEINRKTVLQ